jgi:serine/threonine protein kinase
MTLPTGTALHHGHYVVDAFSAEDTIGPMYLATHIPTGRWVQLRILGSRHPEAIPFPEQRQTFYRYLQSVHDLNHPLFSGKVSGFEDEGVCYQVMEASLGQPLVRFVSADHPVPPRQAIAMVRQVAQGLLALQPLGWQGLTLTPDQLWQSPQDSTLTFTGFDWPENGPQADQHQEAQMVRKLSHLLYYLLTGERAEETQAPLAVDVRNRLPGLPYELDTALQLGNRQDKANPALSLQQWLEVLPGGEALPQSKPKALYSTGDGAASEQTQAPQTQPQSPPASLKASDKNYTVVAGQGTPSAAVIAPSATEVVSAHQSTKTWGWAPAALMMTALVASFGGLGLGLTVRLQPSQAGSAAPLNLEQSFPPLSDWSGDDPIEAWELSPMRRPLPDYGDRPSRPALAPSPVAQPSAPFIEDDASLSSSEDTPTFPASEATDPSLQEEVYFEEREPFTADPNVMPGSPTTEGQINQDNRGAEPKDPPVAPPAPLPDNTQTVEPPAAPPKPLTAPAPLPVTPPSAPAPSTSQNSREPDTTTGSFSGSVTEIAETSEPRTL